jgi:hypothetical protein
MKATVECFGDLIKVFFLLVVVSFFQTLELEIENQPYICLLCAALWIAEQEKFKQTIASH